MRPLGMSAYRSRANVASWRQPDIAELEHRGSGRRTAQMTGRGGEVDPHLLSHLPMVGCKSNKPSSLPAGSETSSRLRAGYPESTQGWAGSRRQRSLNVMLSKKAETFTTWPSFTSMNQA